jgi:hypothetical protein
MTPDDQELRKQPVEVGEGEAQSSRAPSFSGEYFNSLLAEAAAVRAAIRYVENQDRSPAVWSHRGGAQPGAKGEPPA